MVRREVEEQVQLALGLRSAHGDEIAMIFAVHAQHEIEGVEILAVHLAAAPVRKVDKQKKKELLVERALADMDVFVRELGAGVPA